MALVVVVVLVAASVNSDVDHTVTGVFNVGIWIAPIGGGIWLLSKVHEMSEEWSAENAKAKQKKARGVARDQV